MAKKKARKFKYRVKELVKKEYKPKAFPDLYLELTQFELQQSVRIHWQNVLRAIDQGYTNLDDAIAQPYFDMAERDEKLAQGRMIGLVKDMPIFQWLVGIRGIADHTAAKLIALTQGIWDYPYVATLWKRHGLGLGMYWKVNGKIVAPEKGYQWFTVKGRKVPHYVEIEPEEDWELVQVIDRQVSGFGRCFIKQAKSFWLGVVGANFIKKTTQPYYDLYLARKEVERAKPEVKTAGHAHARARRWMIKLFASHYWVRYRQFEGLPITLPWALRQEGHGHAIMPNLVEDAYGLPLPVATYELPSGVDEAPTLEDALNWVRGDYADRD